MTSAEVISFFEKAGIVTVPHPRKDIPVGLCGASKVGELWGKAGRGRLLVVYSDANLPIALLPMGWRCAGSK